MAQLTHAGWQQCTITKLDDPSVQVHAHFNPKEITITKKVPWSKHKESKSDNPRLEFTGADPETLKVELLFDTYEAKTDVYETHIESLRALCLIEGGPTEETTHPPKVMLSWGDKSFLNFKGVITNLSVKYNMFLPDGTPVRATATVDIQQAHKVEAKVKKKKAPTAPANSDDAGA